MSTKPIAFAVLIIFLLVVGPLRAQTLNERPITKEHLLGALESMHLRKSQRMRASWFVKRVSENKVSFHLTNNDERKIRRTGGYLGKTGLGNLVSAIRSNYYVPGGQSMSAEKPKQFITQAMTNSPGGIQAGGDIHINQASLPRHLTDEQKAILITFLKANSKGAIRITCLAGNREARDFAQEIAAVLRASDWQVDGPLDMLPFFTPSSGPLPGLFIEFQNRQSVPLRGQVLQQALGWKGIDFNAPAIEDSGLPADGVGLFVNAKP